MKPPPICLFMTSLPVTIAPDTTVLAASEMMREKKIRHLPVVDDERLVGIVSDRDLKLIMALLSEEANDVQVAMVMTETVFSCGPQAELSAVAAEMLERRCGSAVVVEPEHPTHVLGIFTVTDALRVISTIDIPTP